MIVGSLLIGDSWVAGAGARIDVVNPARGEIVGTIPQATAEEIDAALDAARAAFGPWSKQAPGDRARLLTRAAEVIRGRAEDLGRLMTSEQGKPVNEATGEIRKLADTFDFYAAEATRVHGEVIANDSTAYQSLVVREPVGVVAAISPWNYPAELIGWKVAAGLAAGCTLVVKPPELTPLSPLAIMACLREAGLPAGTVNMVTGPGATVGQHLVESPQVDKVAFTGSSAVGLQILRSLRQVKRVSLELGGNCPMIVTASAESRRRGQGRGPAVVPQLRADLHCHQPDLCRPVGSTSRSSASSPTPPMRWWWTTVLENPAAGSGAAVLGRAAGQDQGASRGCLGEGGPPDRRRRAAASRRTLPMGLFFRPTVVADCGHEMLVMTEETFGPLVGVAAYEGREQAVDLANDYALRPRELRLHQGP